MLNARLVFLGLMTFSSAVLVSMSAPFLPKEMFGIGMSPTGLGMLFSLYPFMVICTAPVVGHFANSNARRVCTLTVALPALIICTLAQGLMEFTPALWISRAAQGVAGGACVTCTYGLVPDWYPEHPENIISVTEFMAAAGYMAGPVLGGILYAMGGYPLPFVGLCLPFAILWIIIQFVGKVSDSDDSSHKRDPADITPRRKKEKVPPPTFRQLLNPRMGGAMIAAFICEFAAAAWIPIIGPFLMEEFGATALYVGFTMAIPAIAYALCGLVLPLVYPLVEKPKIIFWGLFTFGICLCLMNPCHFFSRFCSPRWFRIALLISVQFVNGGANTFAFVPTLPLMLDSVKDIPGDSHGAVSGAWNSMVALGQVLGPLFAEELSQFADFGTVLMLIGVTTIFLALLIYHLTANSIPTKEEHYSVRNSYTTTHRRSYGTVILDA